MKKLTTLVLGAGILLFSATAQAQNSDTTKGSWFSHSLHGIAGSAQIQATYRYTYMGPLNRILGADGLPTLGTNNFWLNLSMNHIHNNWIVEDGIGFTPWTTNEANGIKTSFNQYQA